jgi:hypothetical protein
MHRAILGAPAAPDAHLLSDLGLHQLRRHRSHRRAQRRHLHVGSTASALSPAGRSRHAARWVGLPARAVGLIRPGIALSRLDPRRLPSACSRASHPRRRPPPTTSAGAPPRPTPRWAMPYTAAADQRHSREIAAQRSGRDGHAPHRPTRHPHGVAPGCGNRRSVGAIRRKDRLHATSRFSPSVSGNLLSAEGGTRRRRLCLCEREPVSPLISCALRTTTMNAGRDRRLLLGKGAGPGAPLGAPARC